jgi:PAS domain S-box-containing protein
MREGVVVGLANHTILIAKDGSERAIDDSAAPIRHEGALLGSVLVFRDVSQRRQFERLQQEFQSRLEEQVRERTAQLQASEEHFRLLVEGNRECAIFMLDPNGRIASWNPGAAHIKGYQADEIIGQHFSRFYPPEDIQSGKPARELEIAQRQGKYEEEGWRLRKDGSRLWANVLITALFDAEGRLRGFSKVTRDLTRRKQTEEDARRLIAEQAAREEAERHAAEMAAQREELRVTLESIGDGVIATDAQGNVTLLNPVAQALTGWKLEEASGQPLEEIFQIKNENTGQPAENPVARVLREGIVIGLANHTVLIGRDGIHRPIDDSAAPIRDQQGKVRGVVLVFHDVTEQRRAERALRQVEERMRSVVNHLVDGIISIDEIGTVVTFNPAAERIFGYGAAEVIGQNIKMLMPEPYLTEHDTYLANYLRSGQAKIIGIGREVVGRRKDGSTFPMDLAVSAFHLGERRHFTGIVRDISERKRAEAALNESAEDLARSNLDLEHFAYVASHDLQEPLRAVSGCVQVLQKRYQGKLDERADQLIAHTVDGVSRMQGLINDLLSYSRVGTRRKAFQAADSNVIFQQALANLEVAVTETGAVVTHDDLPVVQADAAQLAQVFQNLLSNALKFRGPEQPRIHVGVRRQGGTWRFRIQDNGIGIQPEYFERIFILFQRLHTRNEYAGSGIGLAICKKIVERHGGCIGVESEPGRGSTFFFTIPER